MDIYVETNSIMNDYSNYHRRMYIDYEEKRKEKEKHCQNSVIIKTLRQSLKFYFEKVQSRM